ncbi:Cyclin domain-containing protein [Aphelenchoides besseyi]|nr:Cyclin domain-containing protein [Aphelenchoides besseyi]
MRCHLRVQKPLDVLTLPKSQRPTPITEFSDGYQRLVEMPTELAISSQVPDDRVVVVMPQEKSSRYGEMQLRNRRVDGRAATLTNEQKNERLHRSISPAAFIDESESAISGSDGEAMAVDESGGLEDEVKNDDSNSAFAAVKRIVTRRGKRQKGKKSAPRPILSPQKVRPVQTETHGPVEINAVEYDMADIDQFLNIQSNDSTLAALPTGQTEQSKTSTPAPPVKSSLKRTRAQSKVSAGSMSDEEEEKEKSIKVEEHSENTSDEEFEGTSEKKARKEADVTLIRGREPRQRAEQSQKRKIPRREGKMNDSKTEYVAPFDSQSLFFRSDLRKEKIDSNKKESKPLKNESQASTPSVEEEMNDYELAKSVIDKVTHSMMRYESSEPASVDTSPEPNDEWASSTIPDSEINGSQKDGTQKAEKSPHKKSGVSLGTDDPDSSTTSVRNKTTSRENDVVQPVTQKTRGKAASRRKQTLNDSAQTEDSTSEVKLVQLPGKQPCKPDDLTQVGHIRAIRMRCSLCDAGAFFCTDLRKHLMYRYCQYLHLAPPELIESRTPCMTEKTADKLIKLADPDKPGRAIYISGKIVSAESPVPYFPDPHIENRLLSTMRSASANRGSPRKIILSRKSALKSTRSSSQQSAETAESCARTQSYQSQPKENTPLSNGSSSKESSPPATTNAILNGTEVKSSINETLSSTTGTEESKAKSTAESSEKSTASQSVAPSRGFDLPCTINIAPPQLKSQTVKQEITPVPEVAPQPQVPISEVAEKHLDESSHKTQTLLHRSPVKPSILSSRSSSKPAATTSESTSSVSTVKTNRSATGSPNLFSSHQQANGAEQVRFYHEMYPSSTQKRHWTFANREEIKALRQKANDEYRHKIQLNGSDPEIEASLLNVDDEELFLKIVTEPGIRFGETFRPSMWPSVRWIAFAYFKRFYLRYAPMEYSPKVIIQACYYLATKIDEFNVSIDEFVANLQKGSAKENAEQILKWEPIIIHRLDYQLTIHCPFRPFEGHVMELKNHGMLGFDLEAIRPYANEFFRVVKSKISDIFREHIFRLCRVDTWKPNAENLTIADKLMLRVEEIRQLVEEQSVGVTSEQKTELQKKMERFSGIPDRVKPSNQQDDQGPVDSDDE